MTPPLGFQPPLPLAKYEIEKLFKDSGEPERRPGDRRSSENTFHDTLSFAAPA